MSIEHRDGVALVTLNPPERGQDRWSALADAWQSLRGNAAVRAVVLASSGTDFCTDPAPSSDVPGWLPAHHRLTKPIVAAVQGRALGAGLVLLGQCDLIIAAGNARFGFLLPDGDLPFQEVAWQQGWLPWGEIARLALLGGDATLDAVRARELGMVMDITEGDPTERALTLANRLASHPAAAVQTTKDIIQQTRNLHVRDAASLAQILAARSRLPG